MPCPVPPTTPMTTPRHRCFRPHRRFNMRTATAAALALVLAVTVSGRGIPAPGQRRPYPTGRNSDPNADRHQVRPRHAAFFQLGKVRSRAAACVLQRTGHLAVGMPANCVARPPACPSADLTLGSQRGCTGGCGVGPAASECTCLRLVCITKRRRRPTPNTGHTALYVPRPPGPV